MSAEATDPGTDATAKPPRRLSLAGLEPPVRWLVGLSLAAWLLVGLLVIAFGLSIEVPGGTLEILDPTTGGVWAVPRVTPPAVLFALGAAAAALTYGSLSPGWRLGSATRVAVALVGVVIGGSLLDVASTLEGLEDQFSVDLVPAAVPGVLRALAWIGTAAALAAAIPARVLTRVPNARGTAAISAAVPYGVAVAAYLLVAATSREEGVPAETFVVGPDLIAPLAPAGFFIAALLMWQVVAGTRASRDLGRGAARTLELLPLALVGFLLLKLTWLVLAYTGALPGTLGGDNATFAASRDDDVWSWLVVAAAAAGGGWWLVRRCDMPTRDPPLSLASAGVITSFLSALALAAVGLLAFAAVAPHVAAEAGILTAIRDVSDWFSDRQLLVQVATVYGAGAAGALLWWARGPGPVACFLVLFAVLALPRALTLTWTWGDPQSTPGWYERGTLDTAVTLMVAVLVFGPWRGECRATDAGLLAILVASTAIAYAGTIVGGIWNEGAFYLALLLPVAYGVTLGARDLNEAGPNRAGRLLAEIGGGAALLAIVLLQLMTDFAAPGKPTEADVARILLAPPLAAILLAGVCTALRRAEAPTAASR